MFVGCSQLVLVDVGSVSDVFSCCFGMIDFQFCMLFIEGVSVNVEVQCVILQVLEDWVQFDGCWIGLCIVWLELGSSGVSQFDLVFFLVGGFGQVVSEVVVIVDIVLCQVCKQCDVFLIDQCGIGGFNLFSCLGVDGKLLQLDEDVVFFEVLLCDYVQCCVVLLQGCVDVCFYIIIEVIVDLDVVCMVFGVDQFNLVGGFYGICVVQCYVGVYLQYICSIVIDGVVLNELVVGGDFVIIFEDVIVLQLVQCCKDVVCSKCFLIDICVQLCSVVDILCCVLVLVEYCDLGINVFWQDVLMLDSVVGFVFVFFYVLQYFLLLLLVLDEVVYGCYVLLVLLVCGVNCSMDFQINRGMQWLVICSEDVLCYYVLVEDFEWLFGNEVVSVFFVVCLVWLYCLVLVIDVVLLCSDVLVLLLFGELDLVMLLCYVVQVFKGLFNGCVLVVCGQGYGMLIVGCMLCLFGQFIDKIDVKVLDVGCLDMLSYVLVFILFNGWEL